MRRLFTSLWIFFGFTALAQDSLFVDLSSPYGAIRTHLFFLSEDQYDAHQAAAPFRRKGITEEAAQEKAIMLKQVLDGEGIFIHMEDVPREADFYDSTLQRHRYALTSMYPEIYVEKVGSKWYYARESIMAIEALHQRVFPFGTDRLLVLLPKLGTRKVMGLHLYQHIGIFILALLSVIVHKIFTLLFERILLNVLLRAGYERLAGNFLLPVARPISIFVVLLLLMLFLPVLQLPPDATQYVMVALRGLIPLFATIVFYRVVDILALYMERLAKKTESTLDDQLVPLIRKTLKTFVVGIGTLFILQNLNIPIMPLLTGISIGGLAFALAAQDTIKNFFGSLMIFIDKPFQIGHWITTGDIDGTVEEVGFRSSRVRTFRNSLMYVPNGKLADSVIDNHGMRQYRRFFTQIAINYSTPPELIETFTQGLRKIVETHPNTRKDTFHVYFNELGSFSLNIMFYIFFEVPDWGAELKARHEVLLEITKLAKNLGVQFAFPTQTLHMENFPGQPSLTPVYPSANDAHQRLNDFFQPTKN